MAQITSTVTNVGDYYIYKLKKNNNNEKIIKPKIMNVLVLDNSGSMGSATKEALNSIGCGMFDLPKEKIDAIPGTVILFDEKAHILSDKIKSPQDLKNLILPRQGQTNITVAIQVGISSIVNHFENSQDKSIHYILTFLSDGNHNCGPDLDSVKISQMQKDILSKEIKLSIIVVGILQNDTVLGMKVKTALETIPMNSLESVYYARNSCDMNSVIEKLNKGCIDSLCKGTPVSLSIDSGVFVENMTNKINSFLYDGETVITVKATQNPKLFVNECIITPNAIQMDTTDIALVIDSLIPKLSQLRVAYGVDKINVQITELEEFINSSEIILEKLNTKTKEYDVSDIGKINITPQQRLLMIKKLKQARCKFQEEKNKLKMLKASVENNSAKQAEYLTGFNKKYASKALVRSDILDITHQEVLTQIKNIKQELVEAIEKDKKLAETRKEDPECSILSLNNAFEQLSEWLTSLDNIVDTDFNDIYSLLVCFGFSAYPVKFDNNNAVQMDPFQTNCNYIEPCMIDTTTLMLSNQMGHKITSPSKNIMTDGLILINPICPNTSLLLRKTMIYQYLCSVTLCRDLYMYHPKMTFAMHAHSLVKVISEYCENKSTAYLELGVKILYSIRKFWGKLCVEGGNLDLFKHWWCELETITQSEKDGCNHPVQMLLMLGAFDLQQLGFSIEDTMTQLVNLLNEIMARKMKMKLNYFAKDNQDIQILAINLMQKIFGIDKTNSPQPNPDIMTQEPTVVSVRESCQHWAKIVENQNVFEKFGMSSIKEYLNENLMSYVQTFNFCLGIQKYIQTNNTSWDNIIIELETTGIIPNTLTQNLTQHMQTIFTQDMFSYFGVYDEHKIDLVSKNMFVQACMFPDSQSRFNINQKSIFDPVTLNEMIVDLRMSIYFEACKVKKDAWLAIIGDVTFERALNCDELEYENMIGVHTHGLSKDQFWAMLRVAQTNEKKLDVFLKKSNITVKSCLKKIK